MNLSESQQVKLFEPDENYEKDIKWVQFRYPLYSFLKNFHRKGIIKIALIETAPQLEKI
jgi:hypothetical protein